MSKIGNHRVEVQESEAYLWGWAWAANGWPQPPKIIRFLASKKRFEARETQRLGWQDYHDQEQSK